MKKLIKQSLLCLFLAGTLLSGNVNATAALTQINAEVEEKAGDSELTIVEDTNAAIETYEITDPVNQRKLLLKFEMQTFMAGGGGDGVQPPK